jgi:hypothetical protein
VVAVGWAARTWAVTVMVPMMMRMMFFIVLYFMISAQHLLALLAISILLVPDDGYDPPSRDYRSRALTIELIGLI